MTAYDFDESDYLEQLKALGKKVEKAEKAKDPLVKLLKVAGAVASRNWNIQTVSQKLMVRSDAAGCRNGP